MTGRGELPVEQTGQSVEQMLVRFRAADQELNSVLRKIQQSGGWDDIFVDALCEPPETFTYGGVFAHIVTFNTYWRLTALSVLHSLGVEVEGFGCPTEFERAVAPWAEAGQRTT